MYNKIMENKKLILLVDDNKDFLEILSTKLTLSGFKIETALNGEEGLLKLKKIKPDLVVLDLEMPVLGGIDAFSKIKEDADLANLKVVFLTNYGEPREGENWYDEKIAREVGAADFIKKSEDVDRIVDIIRSHVV